LNCQICYCRANQPTLCPHCSKVYCEFCITTSLKLKSECPNCRKPIKGQLTHCSRFMNELSGIVGLIFENIEETEKCREHGISLNYFCEDCHKSACCECKMFGAHQTHLFTPISLVYETKYETIRDLLSSLKGRIIQKEEVLTEIEDELILVKSKTEGSITEIEDYTEKYRNKMSNENSSADEEYEDIEELVEEAQELRKIKETLANQLEHAKKVNCYRINE
jgi:tripartite motif-containing protein 37